MVGWIDYFVDAISGYNDHVDALLDYIVGDEGESVGTATAGTISNTATQQDSTASTVLMLALAEPVALETTEP